MLEYEGSSWLFTHIHCLPLFISGLTQGTLQTVVFTLGIYLQSVRTPLHAFYLTPSPYGREKWVKSFMHCCGTQVKYAFFRKSSLILFNIQDLLSPTMCRIKELNEGQDSRFL